MPKMRAISSNGFSFDQQVFDAISYLALNDEETSDHLCAEFPEINNAIWSGSWLDTGAMSVEPEFTSNIVDWIESNYPNISWIDGEPYFINDEPEG